MDRNTRALIVLLVATVTAAAASYGVYQAIKHAPVREVQVATSFVVAAAREVPAGSRLTPPDLKLVPWPADAKVPGSFDKVDVVINRAVRTPVLENEPITETKLVPPEGGAGLPPTIPPGMRAISVSVNEVVGVAGFVTPGTRVDVLLTLRQTGDGTTRVVVSNVQVLTAGTRYDQDKSKAGEPIPTSVVTLLLTPEDAERVVLAASSGQIMLALRNPLDVDPTKAPGARMANLFGDSTKESTKDAPARQAVRRPPAPAPAVAEAAAPPPPPRPYIVEAIRAAKRTEEPIR